MGCLFRGKRETPKKLKNLEGGLGIWDSAPQPHLALSNTGTGINPAISMLAHLRMLPVLFYAALTGKACNHWTLTLRPRLSHPVECALRLFSLKGGQKAPAWGALSSDHASLILQYVPCAFSTWKRGQKAPAWGPSSKRIQKVSEFSPEASG